MAGTGQLKRNNGIDLVTGGISDRGWNAIEEHSVSVVESTAQDGDDLAACDVEDGIERRRPGSEACGVEEACDPGRRSGESTLTTVCHQTWITTVAVEKRGVREPYQQSTGSHGYRLTNEPPFATRCKTEPSRFNFNNDNILILNARPGVGKGLDRIAALHIDGNEVAFYVE